MLNQRREFQLRSVILRMCCEQFHACLCGIPGILKKIVQQKNMCGYSLYLIVCCVKSFLTYIRGLILPNALFVPANMVIPIAGLFMFTCTDTDMEVTVD